MRLDRPVPPARADLAESHDLLPVGTRRAQDVSSSKPNVRVLFWCAEEDRLVADRLWGPLKASLQSSGVFSFVVRDSSTDALAGDDINNVLREALTEWADYVVVAVSSAMLAKAGDDSITVLLSAAVHSKRIVPVLLRPIPRNSDLGVLSGKRLFSRHQEYWSPETADRRRYDFESVPAAQRSTFAARLNDAIHTCVGAGPIATDPGLDHDGDEVNPRPRARGHTLDVERAVRQLERQGHSGFEAGHNTADIPDVDQYLKAWSVASEGTALLALLGDYGIGKTIASQRLVNALWKEPSGPAAHYFDLRDVSGLAQWTTVPSVHEILAQCIAGGWVEDGKPISLTTARERVDELIEESKLWDTVIVIDGLDEVLVHLDASDGQKFTTQLLRLRPVGTDPIVGARTKLMLTCRTHYFTDVQSQIAHFRDHTRGQVHEKDYAAISLLAVTREQIAGYLTEVLGWHQSSVEHLLGSVHDLWDLGSRPFLLAQLADVLPDLAERAERGETVVAATVYDALVAQWLARDTGKHIIHRADKPDMMSYVAFRLWQERSRAAEVRALERWLEDYIDMEGLNARYARHSTEILANDLHTATFLVRTDSGGRGLFRFAHSSMAEFFLARWMLRCLDNDDLRGWAIPIPTEETFQFLDELLDNHLERRRLLNTLASWRWTYNAQVSELLLAYGLRRHTAGDIPLTRINLQGADLRDIQIAGTHDRPINLNGANLRGARLDRSWFDYVHLREADLTGAYLNHAIWNQVVTSGAETAGIEAEGALLRFCGSGLHPSDKSVRVIPREHPADSTAPKPAGIQAMTGHTKAVRAVAFSADGSRLASAGHDGTVIIWDYCTGDELSVLTAHTGGVSTVAFSADGSRLATTGADGKVAIWDPSTGAELHTFTDDRGRIHSVAFTSDGMRLASAGLDGTVKISDPSTGEDLASLVGHSAYINSLAFAPDGTRLASGSADGTLIVWDLSSGRELFTIGTHSADSVAFSADGTRLASAGEDGTVRTWDSITGMEITILLGHTERVNVVAYSPDGTRLASAGHDETVRIWDPSTGEELATLLGQTGRVYSLAFNSDGTRVATGSIHGTVGIWDPSTGEERTTLSGYTYGVSSLAFSSDGARLATTSGDGTVSVWDPSTGEEVSVVPGHVGPVYSVRFIADRAQLATVGEDGTVVIWDLSTNREVVSLPGHTRPVTSGAITADGTRLATAGRDGTMRTWDLLTGEELTSLPSHSSRVFAVAFSADGTRLASAAEDGTVRIWDPKRCDELTTVNRDMPYVFSLAFSPDGSLLASAGEDGSVRLWNPFTGELLTSVTSQFGTLRSVEFSSDGKRLAGGGDYGTVQIWDASTGELLMTTTGHSGRVQSVAFSVDGSRLVSGGQDGTVRLWDLATGNLDKTFVGMAESAAAWRSGAPPRLCFARGDAWRWLRVQTRDESGRICSQDPYEWHYHSRGEHGTPD